MDARRTMLLTAVLAVVAAGLGLWLATTVARDVSTIAVIVATCAVLGSFAPTMFRWLATSRRRSRP